MPRPPSPAVSPRKQPKQQRSEALVQAILVAAIRVLEREGARRFTTIRVAEAAGVSVGSLYQYFPNKEAILFRLQVDEWRATTAVLDGILADASRPPADRLRAAIRAFFQSECDEAPLRLALAAAAPLYRDSPEAAATHRKSRAVLARAVAACAPRASPAQRAFATELFAATMTSLGHAVSETREARAAVDRWADEVSAMLLAYLGALRPTRRRR